MVNPRPAVPPPAPAPRATCLRCLRPSVVCWCRHVRSVATRTRVVLLQHPREHRMPVGTARMAHHALPGSILRVGLSFDDDPVIQEILRGDGPTYVLYPGPAAVSVDSLPRDRSVTLIVLDGTWALARKLLGRTRGLAALPQVAFTPTRPSDYRIRRQPAAHCVSTIEALAEVLAAIEGGTAGAHASFDELLAPFRAMVDAQLDFINDERATRRRRARRPQRPRPVSLAERLRALWSRLVCVQGEANAWPARGPASPSPPELIQWSACRPATGEALDLVIAPRQPLAPGTPDHARLSPGRLAAGLDLATARGRWQAFLRPDDVTVAWGRYHMDRAEEAGIALPEAHLDLRGAFAHEHGQRHGTVEACAMAMGLASPHEPAAEGRAGERLRALMAVLVALADSSRG